MKMEAWRRRTRLLLPFECQSRTDLLRRSLGLGARLMTYFEKLREDSEQTAAGSCCSSDTCLQVFSSAFILSVSHKQQ